MRIRVLSGTLASILIALTATGCGLAPKGPIRDPDARPPSPSGGPSPSASRRTTAPTPARSASPSPTGFSNLVAVACNGKPSTDQVLAVLRRATVLTAQARPTVSVGPVCAGTWQYTVVEVSGQEPLHVVTRGAPTSLSLVAAGTNPCTPKVRASAPSGIVAAMRCDT
jgi:hypothetical protein